MADQFPVYSGLLSGDTNATGNTYAKRDGSGNLTVASIIATMLAGTGGITLGNETYATTAVISAADGVVLLNATSAAFTATLPPVAASGGVLLFCIKIDSSGNLPTIKGNASEVIYHAGASANTYTALSTQGRIAWFYCDGTQWWAGTFN
jgi:hypothetical protein